jgi:hypothetical protein
MDILNGAILSLLTAIWSLWVHVLELVSIHRRPLLNTYRIIGSTAGKKPITTVATTKAPSKIRSPCVASPEASSKTSLKGAEK